MKYLKLCHYFGTKVLRRHDLRAGVTIRSTERRTSPRTNSLQTRLTRMRPSLADEGHLA